MAAAPAAGVETITMAVETGRAALRVSISVVLIRQAMSSSTMAHD